MGGSCCGGLKRLVKFCGDGDRGMGGSEQQMESTEAGDLDCPPTSTCREVFDVKSMCDDGVVSGRCCGGLKRLVKFCGDCDRGMGGSEQQMESTEAGDLDCPPTSTCWEVFDLKSKCDDGVVSGRCCRGLKRLVKFCGDPARRLTSSQVFV